MLLRAVRLQSPTGDPEVLNVPPATNGASHPNLREEVEAAVKSLKKGKSAGVDNIPAELLWRGGGAVVGTLLLICNGIWQTGGWPAPWAQSLVVTLPGNGDLQLCWSCRAVGLVGHPGGVVLGVILGHLRPETEGVVAEQQAGFRLRVLSEVPLAPAGPLSCFHLLQGGIQRGVVCGILGNYEVVQYQYRPY